MAADARAGGFTSFPKVDAVGDVSHDAPSQAWFEQDLRNVVERQERAAEIFWTGFAEWAHSVADADETMDSDCKVLPATMVAAIAIVNARARVVDKLRGGEASAAQTAFANYHELVKKAHSMLNEGERIDPCAEVVPEFLNEALGAILASRRVDEGSFARDLANSVIKSAHLVGHTTCVAEAVVLVGDVPDFKWKKVDGGWMTPAFQAPPTPTPSQ